MKILHVLCVVLLPFSVVACNESTSQNSDTGTQATPSEVDSPTSAKVDAPAFNYPGGWLDDTRCVDICGVTPESPIERPKAVICFDPDDPECAAKTGQGDYDYLLLSQHWIPSMCRGLSEGYDTTVTHQAGSVCTKTAPNRLTLHGLWPNYEAGFPQCCGNPLPLDPQKVDVWPSELRQRLEWTQGEPTTTHFDEAVCEIYNHEWQKHGTCFTDASDQGAQEYFEVGLQLTDALAEATTTLDGWAGTTRSRQDIEALYPQTIQLLCDAHHPEDLLEIHTCWSREHEPIDCADTKGFGSLVRCGDHASLPTWP